MQHAEPLATGLDQSKTSAAAVPAPGASFNFADHLFRVNAQRAHKPAFIDDRGSLRYGELQDRAQRIAQGLLNQGLQREDRVLLLMHDSNDWPVSFLGCLYAGIVPVAVNTLLSADDYAYMLTHSQAKAALVSAPLRAALAQAIEKSSAKPKTVIVSGLADTSSANASPSASLGAPDIAIEALYAASPMVACADTHADEIAFWLYSSGSTGKPKGTVHTHGNPYWTAELYGKRVLQLQESDICFSAAKLFFAYGLGNGLSFPLSVGATVVLMAERPTPDAVFKRWVDHKPTIFFGAPTGYAGMLASPNLPARSAVALRMCSSAGEALPAEIGQRFTQHFGVEIIDGIGSTEMLHIFLSNQPGRVRYGTTGWPVPGYAIELRDDKGQPVAPGEVGDLYIHGPSSALMYWQNREKSQETFRGAWTKSGDKYVQNDDGSFTYAGRSDDMLKVSGIYVSPFEIESTLMQHPAILEAAVIGISDAEGLTKTKAFVVRKPGQQVSEEELKAFTKEKLAAYKYPRFFAFVDELPKTATGKIQRFRLREQEHQSK
ncbi:MAG: benzoate-CoA ligase family protein [Burkholderiaceae bacterium]